MDSYDENIGRIVTDIENFCLKHPAPQVLGTELGEFFSDQIRDLDVKEKFGGIRGLIEARCTNVISTGKSGMDNVYTHRKRLGDIPAGVSKGAGEKESERKNPWRAFSNPMLRERLFFSPDNKKLVVLSEGEEIPEGYCEVQKVTEDEYRKIASLFIQSEFPQNAEEFELKGNNFWLPFSKEVGSRGGKTAHARLLSLRMIMLNKFLEERLKSLGLDEDEIEGFASYVRGFRRKKLLREETLSPERVAGSTHLLPMPTGIREIVRACVDTMSEAELRQLWLPLGIMLDALLRR